MERITDAFAWPFRDPGWAAKLLVIGLILIVPIAGAINGIGWMLAAIDRLRAGEPNLPRASFSYVGRGLPLFAVTLVYVLALAVLMAVLFIPAAAIYSSQGRGPMNAGLISVAVLLNVLFFSVGALGSLLVYFATPAIVVGTERNGIAGGLNVRGVVRTMRRSPVNTLIAGLMLIAVGLLAQLGLVACVIGVVFTSAYALAAQAWIVRSYELGLTPKED